MKAGGALVLTEDAREAASRAAGEARASLGGLAPTFAVLFASAYFFCAGELGPVGGRNFLHAFTASIALFPDVAP
jgi:small ligand-binding sensory domain FIST